MKLKWLKSRRIRKSPGVATRGLAGIIYVPRLEPLEDRNLPSGLPTVVLSDGTVVQMTLATNAFVDVQNQGTTNVVSNFAVAVTVAYYPQANFTFVRVTDPVFQTSGTTILTDDIGGFVPSQFPTVMAQGNDPSGLFSPTISTTIFVMSDRLIVTGYDIGLQTQTNQSSEVLHVSIAAFDSGGNPSSAFTTTVRGNSPVLTNPLQLPATPNTGQVNFEVNNPIGAPSGPSGNTIGGVALVNQAFFEIPGNQSNTLLFTSSCANYIAVFTLIQELEKGDLPNQPIPLPINEILPDNSGKTTFASPITNSTSLVLADTGPWLTLSIIQDSYLRSTSVSAQITWSGQRGPTETPVHGAAGNRRSDFSWEAITAPSKELGFAVNVEVSSSSQSRTRPMEAMVSDILTSLPQAKRDDQDEERSLAALPVIISTDEKSKSQASLDWPFAGTVMGLLGTATLPGVEDPAAGDKEPSSLAMLPRDNNSPQENQPENSLTGRPVFENRRWIHLAEGVGGFLLLLAWPAVIELGLGTRNPASDRADQTSDTKERS